jgi:tryptophan halogenase
MEIPDSLAHRMELFKQSGKVYKFAQELFGESSWLQVLIGQGLMPEQYHPIVDLMPDSELNDFLMSIKQNVKRTVSQFPTHHEFIQHYCKSSLV